jgi:hypothetical protein
MTTSLETRGRVPRAIRICCLGLPDYLRRRCRRRGWRVRLAHRSVRPAVEPGPVNSQGERGRNGAHDRGRARNRHRGLSGEPCLAPYRRWGHALRRSRAPIYAAAGTAIAAFAAGGYLLHINGEGTCGLSGADSCKYNYATASHGWALLGAGAAAVGFGVYWHLGAPADGQIQLNPVVSAGTAQSGAMVSLGGSF